MNFCFCPCLLSYLYCLIFLIAYIKVFSFSGELLAGSAGASIAQMAAFVGIAGTATGISFVYNKFKHHNPKQNNPQGGGNNNSPGATPVPVEPVNNNPK